MDLYRKEVLAFVRASRQKEFCVFDTETTGLSTADSDVIQFSAVKYAFADGEYKVTDVLDTYINPRYHIPEKITQITGITDAAVKDAPDFVEAAKMIKKFFGGCPLIAGYNSVNFDEKFLKKLYKHIGEEFVCEQNLDVLRMAREKMPAPHKLSDLAQRIGVADKYTFHSSLDDAKATFDVFMYLLPMYENS